VNINILTFLLLVGSSLGARGEGYFVTGDLGLNVFPNWVNAANSAVYRAGYTYSSTSQSKTSFGLGVNVGQWMNQGFGWEIGYADFGSVTGYSTFGGNFGNSFGTSYKFALTASHAEILMGSSSGLFGKVGFYDASTQLTSPGQSISPHRNSGVLLGIGGRYISDYSDHLAHRFGIDLYRRVKFTDLSDYSKVTSGTITKIYLGEEYTF
jgi:hypothetical protein